LINCRVKLIIYPAGARGDFVCGWAGLLPNVFNNCWGLDPITGFSQCSLETKMLDYGSTLDEILKKQNLSLDTNSNLFYVTSCHGHNLDVSQLAQVIDSGVLQLYAIDVTNADKSTIAWEWMVKTYLSQRNTIFFEETHRSWLIDLKINQPHAEITNQLRIDTVTDLAQKLSVTTVDQILNSPDITVIDYTKLFAPGGSYYFCDKLELDAPEVCHNFWNQMLPFACSPDSINVWGHSWNKKDFFNAKTK
jgi:hypothetical protein